MKYGKYEYERSYLLDSDCLRDKDVKETKKITDKYLSDTKLRLRVVVKNKETIYKLTQKEELNPAKKGILKINTLYLSQAEFEKINIIEGIEIEKTRHLIEIDQIKIGVDRINLNGKELFIAEVEFETEVEMNTFSMPLPHMKEITGIEKYSGYEIAKEYSN